MSPSPHVERILDELVSLPSLPTTLGRITQMLDDPNARLADIGKVIARDPSLSLKALRLVNSAYYALRDKVNTVERAVILIGVKSVKNLVLTATVFETLKCGEEQLLRHSLAAATAARNLARSAGPLSPFADPEEAFMYGLLHDVGKIVMRQYLPGEWKKIVPAITNGIRAHEIERQHLGIDHAELGALLAHRWKLPDLLITSIGSHHHLERCSNDAQRSRASYLALTDWMCYEAGYPALQGAMCAIPDEMWTTAGFQPEDLAHLVQELRDSSSVVEEMAALAA
jgi:putative nucleotidyltransferase with HDIG domain